MGVSRISGVVATGAAVAALALIGCHCEAQPPASSAAAEQKGEKSMTIQISSTAFAAGQKIPKKHSGEGEDVSPALAWSNLPPNTQELALVVDDPDAPTPEPWVHWVIYKIPADASGLPENVAKDPRPKQPNGALQGRNSWPSGQTIGYRGPMPPPRHGVHHYRFTLYALDVKLNVQPGLEKNALLKLIQGHVLAQGQTVGAYER